MGGASRSGIASPAAAPPPGHLDESGRSEGLPGKVPRSEASDSSSDDDDVLSTRGFAAALQSSSDEEDAAPAAKGAAADGAVPRAGGGKKAGSGSSSGSSSSSSSSCSSDSESESDAAPLVKAPAMVEIPVVEEEEEESEEEKRRRHLQALRGAQLRRDELLDLMFELPKEQWETAVLRSIVRLTIGGDACVIAEVVAIEESPEYTVTRKNGDPRLLSVQFKCRRAASERLIKITTVSNQEVTDSEFEQWKRLMLRAQLDPERYVDDQLRHKVLDISQARKFAFTDDVVSGMLKRKTNLEFEAQKKSRMWFQVQCAIAQMDISGIRDQEVDELQRRYKESLEQAKQQDAKSAESQAEWFKMRANLYSLKMINEKNLTRQYRDDKHALHYTLQNEASGKQGLNPFERRACRPVCAWDTKLTQVDGLGNSGSKDAADDQADAATPAAAPAAAGHLNGAATSSSAGGAGGPPAAAPPKASPEPPLSRLDNILQAHRQANLLAKLGALPSAA